MTTLLVVDYNSIIKGHKLKNIQNKIEPIPDSKFDIGVILAIPTDIYTKLESIPKGGKRVDYINTPDFVSSIADFAFVMYNSKKKSCKIVGNITSQILTSLLYTFPNDTILFTETTKENISNLIKLDFHDPFICDNTVYLVHENTVIPENKIDTERAIANMYEASLQKLCTMTIVINKYTRRFFKNLAQMGATLNNNGSITQKEVGGRLITQNSLDPVKIFEVDKNSLINGSEEGVGLVNGIINFHSHPRDAYKRHDTDVGWPSGQDYVGFFHSTLLYDTICHFVITIEGVYMITFTEEWLGYNNKFSKKALEFIEDEFSICKDGNKHNEGKNDGGKNGGGKNSSDYESDDEEDVKTIEEYLEKINGKRYNNLQIFEVKLIDWNNLGDEFVIKYRKIGEHNCFAHDETAKHYKNLCIS